MTIVGALVPAARPQYAQDLVRRAPAACARWTDVRISAGSGVYSSETEIRGSEPYLFPSRWPEIDIVAPISAGSNTFPGTRSVIMPGVRIGSNCGVGCASVVTKHVPDSTCERKLQGRSIHTGLMERAGKERRIREIFGAENEIGR